MSTLAQKIDYFLYDPSLLPDRIVGELFFTQTIGLQITRSGDTYRTPADMNPTDRFRLFSGTYEAAECQILKRFSPCKLIIELGSNIGYVARHAIQNNLVDGGLYICVEPNPLVHEVLASNMAETKRRYPRRDFHIVAAAVGDPANDHTGACVDFVVRPNLGSGLVECVRYEQEETLIKVSTRSLSSLIQEFAPNDDSPVSVICDIEGGEIIMCQKDRTAFDRVDQLAIELHTPNVTGRSETPADMHNAFVAMGFHQVMSVRRGTCCLFKRSLS